MKLLTAPKFPFVNFSIDDSFEIIEKMTRVDLVERQEYTTSRFMGPWGEEIMCCGTSHLPRTPAEQKEYDTPVVSERDELFLDDALWGDQA